jgi:DNA-directed RNA polymerase specialized sigma24 family protein
MPEPPELTARHVNTALKEARRWARNAREKEDMEGIAILALVTAWRAWDPQKAAGGNDSSVFFGYLVCRVRWAIKRHMQSDNRLMRGAGKTFRSLEAPARVNGRKGRYSAHPHTFDVALLRVELTDLLTRVLAREDPLSVRCLCLAAEDRSHREIALLVGLPKATVTWRIARLVERLRARFPELVESL